MIACLFPGQGSQYIGMGQALFDTVPEFLAAEAEIDALLGYSVREVCRAGPEERLRDTRYTQPCMFVVNALSYYDRLRTHGAPASDPEGPASM
jgi:malonyl CoA-acyl carrier protein transacylase